MIEIQDIVYSMSFLEFMTLASLKGINTVYGLSLPIEEITDNQLLETLNNLMKKEILQNTDKKLSLQSVYDEMFNLIKSAEECILVYPSDHALPVSFCYVSDDLVVVQPDAVKPSYIKIQIIEKDKFKEYLEAMNYLPEADAINNIKSETETKWEVLENSQIFYTLEELLQDRNNMLVIELRCIKNSISVYRICVHKEGLNIKLWIGDEAQQFYKDYSLMAIEEAVKYIFV